MRWTCLPVILSTVASVSLAAPAAEAATTRAAAKAHVAAPVARPGYTTPSPAGIVYRRANVPLPAEAATTAEVAASGEIVVAPRPFGPSDPSNPGGAVGAGTSTNGTIGGGVGVNVAAPPSSNRQPNGSGF